VTTLIHVILSRIRGFLRSKELDRDFDEELAAHLASAEEDYVRRGMTPEEARRRARVDLGGLQQLREAGRAARGLAWLSGFGPDVKLGLRMLYKYWGLTFAGGVALTTAVGIGAGWYDVRNDLLHPTLPFVDGDRVVEIELVNLRPSSAEQAGFLARLGMRSSPGLYERRLLHEFLLWRGLRSIDDLGVYRTIERNLIFDNSRLGPMTVAETTAAAFRLARVPAILGRTLLETDERPGAPGVVVLGYDLWQQWFGGRPDALGQTVQLENATATVVGIMPKGFAFPINHELWIPLETRPSGYAPLEGHAGLHVFGRLAPGVTLTEADAELNVLAEREAAAFPITHEYLRPRVKAYGHQRPVDGYYIFDLSVTHLPVLLVLIVASTTVVTLFSARTATRDAEIAIRYALGASRGRIVGQLFVEALVLASISAAVGLAVADQMLKWGIATLSFWQNTRAPFWIDPGLNLATVLYASSLAVASAAILSVLPALKALGSHVQAQLGNLGTGGSSLRFGRIWSAAVIAKVALTVTFLPVVVGIVEEAVGDVRMRSAFPLEQYLAVRFEVDREAGPAEESVFMERVERLYSDFERRIASEPGVVSVTFGDRLPGLAGVYAFTVGAEANPLARISRPELELSPGRTAPLGNFGFSRLHVSPGYFNAFQKPILTGREFHGGDVGSRTVIVNQAFARLYTGGASPVGLRLRYDSADPESWFEIVGVVSDFGVTPTDRGEASYVFHAASPRTVAPLMMGVRVIGDPQDLAARVGVIAGELDPGIRLYDVLPLDELAMREVVTPVVGALSAVGIVALGLFLSGTALFSLMSVTVARRRREIGVRLALGASPARLLASVFSRALVLLGSGVVFGNILFVLLMIVIRGDLQPVERWLAPTLATSALMLTVGLLACVKPATQMFRMQPADTLKTV
jgi:predicted permease